MKAWAKACVQERPSHDPPALVQLDAMFLCRKLRDEDNLTASLKAVLDTLRQKQSGAMRWRQGLYLAQGYFVDDDPAHLKLGQVWQERCSPDLEEVVLEIVAIAQNTKRT